MKKIIFILSAVLSSASFAGDYATFDYSVKDKQNSAQQNTVYGLNVGHKFTNGLTLEGRMENEVVNTPSHEGLLQVKGVYDINTGTPFTPFAAVGTGYKAKASSDFNFYVAEVGAKMNAGPVGLKYAYRLRDAYATSNNYRTTEHSVTGSMDLDKSNSLFVKYARERGDSDYNTWGVGLKHAF